MYNLLYIIIIQKIRKKLRKKEKKINKNTFKPNTQL